MTTHQIKHKQQGMTLIGLIIMFVFIGFLLLAVLRVFPLYYENNSVTAALQSFSEEFKSEPNMPLSKMRTNLQRRLEVQDVRNLNAKDIKFTRSRNGYTVDASYHPVVNYIGNINFMLDFEHVIELEK